MCPSFMRQVHTYTESAVREQVISGEIGEERLKGWTTRLASSRHPPRCPTAIFCPWLVFISLPVDFSCFWQKFLAASVALQGRRGGLPFLAERLLMFVFTQASPLNNDKDEDGIERDGAIPFSSACIGA